MPIEHDRSIAGQVWLITQRCHQRQFLLQDEVDRRRWLYWLYQAKRRYGLSVLNYVVTSNHVHLLVQDDVGHTIDACMRMINSRTTSEFNRHQGRRGVFWARRYQRTAVQTNAHLARCMTYIDMNMVRAGEVDHPEQWRCGGYYESRRPQRRGGRIDHANVRRLLQFSSDRALLSARNQWISSKLAHSDLCREPYWSDSFAVGDLGFALKMKRALAYAHPGGRAQREQGCFAVRQG